MRSPRRRQLPFVFADSPGGGGDGSKPDGSGGHAYLLHTAKAEEAPRPGAPADGSGRLLERSASRANLARALLHVARRKGAPGIDGKAVGEVVHLSPKLLPRLHHELRQETYRPGDVRRAWIPKPGGGRRGLGIPNVVDRWVQQALHQVLGPLLDPTFHPCSHGFRPGRGVETALADIERYLAEDRVWLVNIDLASFFDEVHHQRLLGRLRRHVDDGRVERLVNRFLKAGVVMPDGVRVPTKKGTPQGGPLSPLLSNIVLDELDWEMDRRGLHFVRYADDFIVFVRSERAAHRVMDSLIRFIEKRLRLRVNRDKSQVTRADDTHFLGFRFRRRPDGTTSVRLSSRSIERMNARIRELTPRGWGQSLRSCMDGISLYFRGWMAHFRWLSYSDELAHFDGHVRRRLRAIVLRHKRRDRHLYRHLRDKGVSHEAARKAAYDRTGYWARSHTFAMSRAYPNRWFGQRMTFLVAEWQRYQPRPATGQLELFQGP